ncbi:MFS transporter [Salinithrix halophila]|uniref:MFS transporter n=1 Tax=Salinithrix halophila TaxID=1485204 RepID=A0ABV8JMI6_9BACL
MISKAEDTTSRSVFAPLGIRSYRRLFTAQLFSDLGNWFDFIAIEALIVYHWGLGAGALAAFAITTGIPWILVGPWLAVVVDRSSKKILMIMCCLLRIPFVIGFIFVPNLYVLLPLVFFKEILDVIFDPARQSYMRFVVPRDQLQEANMLSQFSMNGAKILAPTLGGIIVAAFDPQMVFILEGIGFLLAFIALLQLPKEKRKTERNQESGLFWNDFVNGIRYIQSNRILVFTIGSMTFSMFLIWFFDKLIVLWAKKLGMGIDDFGTLLSVIAVGSILGTFLVTPLRRRFENPLAMIATVGLVGG